MTVSYTHLAADLRLPTAPRRYYTNIVGKYGAQVQAVLQKDAGLDIRMLLPLPGHVWRQALGYIQMCIRDRRTHGP